VPDTLPRSARIVEKVRENPKTVSLVLDKSMPAAPGQFAMLWLPGVDEKPFSIAGASPLVFTISRVGPFSEAIHGLKPGDSVWVRGPFGTGWSISAESALLVGGGYGAAPLAFLARVLGETGAPREVALGARTAQDLLFVHRFAALGMTAHVSTEDGSAGARGRVTDVVAPLLGSGRFRRLCACGPEGMLESLDELCRRAGVPAELSREAYMRCGIGMCGSCEHGGRLVCMDGPVFRGGAPGGTVAGAPA
jgi:dihydroorotate dehydrogenase electron transfer subunit